MSCLFSGYKFASVPRCVGVVSIGKSFFRVKETYLIMPPGHRGHNKLLGFESDVSRSLQHKYAKIQDTNYGLHSLYMKYKTGTLRRSSWNVFEATIF